MTELKDELPAKITGDLGVALEYIEKHSVPNFRKVVVDKIKEYGQHYSKQFAPVAARISLHVLAEYPKILGEQKAYLFLVGYAKAQSKLEPVVHGFYLIVNEQLLCCELLEIDLGADQ